MCHEPCRLIGDAQRAVQLVRADPLLTASHQAEAQQPFVERDLGVFEDCPDCHSEWLAAGVAVNDSGARALAASALQPLGLAAAWTHRAVRPVQRLKMLPSRVGIGIDRMGQGKRRIGHFHNIQTLLR